MCVLCVCVRVCVCVLCFLFSLFLIFLLVDNNISQKKENIFVMYCATW